MEPEAHRAVLQSDSRALAESAHRGLDAVVVGCPGWTVADVVRHTGIAQDLVEQRMRAAPDETIAMTETVPPSEPELVDWFDETSSRLVTALGSVDIDAVTWTMWKPDPCQSGARFWHRHIARETAIHRWDAELAHGRPAPIDPELAADGVDDFLVAWLPDFAAKGRTAAGRWAGEKVAFERTDGPGEWLVTFEGPGDVSAVRGGGHADVTVRGSASDLALWTMNRTGLDGPGVVIEGDERVAARWFEEVRYGGSGRAPH